MTGEEGEAGLAVVGLVVECVVFADGDVCVVAGLFDEAGLIVVVGLVVEFVVGEDSSLEELADAVGVGAVVGVVLVVDDEFVEEV